MFNSAWFWILFSILLQYPMRILATFFGLNNIDNDFDLLGLLDAALLVNIPIVLYSIYKGRRYGLQANCPHNQHSWAAAPLLMLGLISAILASPLVGDSESIFENHINAYGKTQYAILANVFLLSYINICRTTLFWSTSMLIFWAILTNSRWTIIYLIYLLLTSEENISYKRVIGLFLFFMTFGGALIMAREGSAFFDGEIYTKLLASTIFSHFDSLSTLTLFKEADSCLSTYANKVNLVSLFSDILPSTIRFQERPIIEFNDLCFPELFSRGVILQLPLMIDLRLRFGLLFAVLIYTAYFILLVNIFDKSRYSNRGTAAYCVLLFIFGAELPISGVIRMSIDLAGILLITRMARIPIYRKAVFSR